MHLAKAVRSAPSWLTLRRLVLGIVLRPDPSWLTLRFLLLGALPSDSWLSCQSLLFGLVLAPEPHAPQTRSLLRRQIPIWAERQVPLAMTCRALVLVRLEDLGSTRDGGDL